MRPLPRRTLLRGSVTVALAAFAPGLPPAFAEPLPLAINGYDPVAYFTNGAPTRGVPGLEYEWDEHRYRFANIRHRDLFKADPARYAPRFANLCAMALAKGMALEANPEYWLVSDGTLFLFAADIGPKLFQQDAPGHTAKADGNRKLLNR